VLTTNLGLQRGFAPDEYSRRLTNIRTVMAERGIEALLVNTKENIFYLTGYQTFGSAEQFLVVTLDRDPLLMLRHLESYLVPYTSVVNEVITWDDDDDPVDVLKELLSDYGLADKPLGIEKGSPSFTATLYEALAAKVDRLVDGSGLIESLRLIKSEAEIELIRQAARYTEAGMRAAIKAVIEGNTDNDVAAAAYEAMTKAGSEYMATDPIVTSGPRSGIPHTTYYRRRLQRGDAVLIELGADHERYFAPLMRTATVGSPPDIVRNMTQTCIDALNAAIDRIRPGITSAEAHDACQRVIDERGYTDNFRKRLGYCIGVGFKSWNNGHIMSLRKNDQRVLKPGMVFHTPPALRIYNEYGVGVSETILVTETGCEALTNFPRELFYQD